METHLDTVLCSLGRNGDVLNSLRAVPLLNAKYGGRIAMMVARPYVDLLEGCSFVEPFPFEGQFENIHDALAIARSRYKNVINAAVYGHNYHVDQKTESFCIEAWRLMGIEHAHWETPLIFDRRDEVRETDLIKNIPTGKPWLLYNLVGNSSPFPFTGQLRQQLRKWRDRFEMIDLSLIKADRFYDLLALYDRAALLITIDTGTLHLAAASKVPTIALITDKPSMWHGAAPTCNAPVKIRYGDYPKRAEEIDQLISSLLTSTRDTTCFYTGPKLIHIWSEYAATGEDAKRYAFTKTTWQEEWVLANWQPKPLTDQMFKRNSRTVLRDVRTVPFIKDMIELGIDGASDDDVIVLTNNDTCFMKGIGKAILRDAKEYGALSCHRWDFDRGHEPEHHFDLMRGIWYCGCDLFAFTVAWWKKHRDEYPDMLLGTEAWDWMMRELIKMHGGPEWHTGTWHTRHTPFWHSPRVKNSNPAQLHNKKLAREFLTKHRLPQDGFSR